MTRQVLIVDVETCPSDMALEMPCPEEWLTSRIKDNFKPDTVERYRAENLASWPEERTRRASLDWRIGKICAIGWQIPGEEPEVFCSPAEGFLLTKFWTMMTRDTDTQISGFYIRDFDLPWIKGRSAAMRVTPTRKFHAPRYDVRYDVLDWADVLSNYGSFSQKGWSLKQYAETFGLPMPIGDGKEVAGWMATGETEKVLDHLRGDLATTTALDQLFRPVFV